MTNLHLVSFIHFYLTVIMLIVNHWSFSVSGFYDDVYSPMKAENTQLQETEWTEDRQTY